MQSYTFYFCYLKRLMSSMHDQDKDMEQFGITYNDVDFDCILDISCTPIVLMIGTSKADENFACILPITFDAEHNRYICSMPNDKFFKLRDLLHLQYTTGEHFSSFLFLRFVDQHLPAQASPQMASPAVVGRLRKEYISDDAREEGFLFRRWLSHKGQNNGHVTKQNLEKTRLLLGTNISEYCAERDISSQWTTDPTKAGPLTNPITGN